MIALIIGGSASGKSEYAENLCLKLGGKVLYVATMQPFGKEAKNRILRHLALREGKGFSSIDCYTNLAQLSAVTKSYKTVLVECISNLVANEMFSENGDVDRIYQDILVVSKSCENLVIVSNNVFEDGNYYSKETEEYIKTIGEINSNLAKIADIVVEVVASIEIVHKGVVV